MKLAKIQMIPAGIIASGFQIVSGAGVVAFMVSMMIVVFIGSANSIRGSVGLVSGSGLVSDMVILVSRASVSGLVSGIVVLLVSSVVEIFRRFSVD